MNKMEWLNDFNFNTRAEAKKAVFEYTELFYNRHMIHSTNGYIPSIMLLEIFSKNKNVLKLNLIMKNGIYIDAIYFGDIEEFENIIIDKYGADELNRLYNGKCKLKLDLAYYPSVNEYNGRVSIQVVVENFR